MKTATILLSVVVFMGASAIAGPAPISAPQGREEFTAVAQMPSIAGSPMVGSGATANLTISIDSFSTEEEARTMAAAFAKGQHKALRKALEKAPVRARVSFEGRNGFFELKLLRSKTTADGRQIYGISDRTVRAFDAYYSGRSHLEEFGILQLDLTKKGDTEEGTGALIHKSKIKSFDSNSITLDDNGIEPVRLTIRKP
jgi:hypothetical protein